MVEMTDLPPKVLHLILVVVAASSDGARELARIGQTCNKFWPLTKNPDLLKVVNFQRLTFTVNDFMMHHHAEDLLCLSARAGNHAALVIFGKALLVNDQWFWSLVLEDNHRAFSGDITPPEALHQHSLVRMLILQRHFCNGSPATQLRVCACRIQRGPRIRPHYRHLQYVLF